jgi:hypothetical protein
MPTSSPFLTIHLDGDSIPKIDSFSLSDELFISCSDNSIFITILSSFESFDFESLNKVSCLDFFGSDLVLLTEDAVVEWWKIIDGGEWMISRRYVNLSNQQLQGSEKVANLNLKPIFDGSLKPEHATLKLHASASSTNELTVICSFPSTLLILTLRQSKIKLRLRFNSPMTSPSNLPEPNHLIGSGFLTPGVLFTVWKEEVMFWALRDGGVDLMDLYKLKESGSPTDQTIVNWCNETNLGVLVLIQSNGHIVVVRPSGQDETMMSIRRMEDILPKTFSQKLLKRNTAIIAGGEDDDLVRIHKLIQIHSELIIWPSF